MKTVEIDGIPWNEERRDACLEGTYELDKIARVLPTLVTQDEDQEYFIVRALAGRMLRITDMLLSALNDVDVSDERLTKFINFEHGQG